MAGRALPHRRLTERTVPLFACPAFSRYLYGNPAHTPAVFDAPARADSTTRVRSGSPGTKSQERGTP